MKKLPHRVFSDGQSLCKINSNTALPQHTPALRYQYRLARAMCYRAATAGTGPRGAEYARLLIPRAVGQPAQGGRSSQAHRSGSVRRPAKRPKRDPRRGSLGQALNKRKERLNKSKLVSRCDPPLLLLLFPLPRLSPRRFCIPSRAPQRP